MHVMHKGRQEGLFTHIPARSGIGHRGDRRHAKVLQLHDEGLEVPLHEVPDVGKFAVDDDVHRRVGEVLAGAKCPAGTRQDQNPDLLVRLDRIQCLVDLHHPGPGCPFFTRSNSISHRELQRPQSQARYLIAQNFIP
jgi:hypothetical protein